MKAEDTHGKKGWAKRDKSHLAIVVAVIILLLLVGGWVIDFLDLWEDISPQFIYRRTTGTVLSKRLVPLEESDTTYKLDIRYSYEVEGAKYEGTRYEPGEGSFHCSRSRGESHLARYEVGKLCTVYYNPEDPSDCALDLGFSVFALAFWSFLAGIALAFCAVIASGGSSSFIDKTLEKLSGSPQAASETLPGKLWYKIADEGSRLRFTSRPRQAIVILAGLAAGFMSQMLWPLLISSDFSIASLYAFPFFLFIAYFATCFYSVYIMDGQGRVLTVERHRLGFTAAEEIGFDRIDRIAPEGYGQYDSDRHSRQVRLIFLLKDGRKLKVMSASGRSARGMMAILLVRLRFLLTGETAACVAEALDEIHYIGKVAEDYAEWLARRDT